MNVIEAAALWRAGKTVRRGRKAVFYHGDCYMAVTVGETSEEDWRLRFSPSVRVVFPYALTPDDLEATDWEPAP